MPGCVVLLGLDGGLAGVDSAEGSATGSGEHGGSTPRLNGGSSFIVDERSTKKNKKENTALFTCPPKQYTREANS